MMNPQQSIQDAVRHHQAGRLLEAEKLYRRILMGEPRNADAMHLLGVLYGQSGRRDEAIRSINAALIVRPDDVEAPEKSGPDSLG